MYAKIQIKGKMKVKTGMHIGGNSAFAAIGSVDSPVVKDPLSCNPMIPGTSIKGKIRSLLARSCNENIAARADDDCEQLLRLFGSAKFGQAKCSRVLFSDMFLSNEKELREQGLQSMTEVKFENTINRATGVANPRQIERVVRGAEYEVDIIYEVENEREAAEDIALLAEGMKLLQYDYLGGNGTRGYGKIEFEGLRAQTVIGRVDPDVLQACNEKLQEISA